jgi:hypothetical protein
MLEAQVNTLRLQIEALLREYPELADDEFLRADMLEGETGINDVLTAIHRMIEDSKALREGTQPRINDLIARAQRFQKRMDFGRDLISKILEAASLKKLELPEVTLSLRNNPQQLVGDPNPMMLPDDLVKIARIADRKKIREALVQGQTVEGCSLSNAPPTLMIRIK